MQSLNVVFHVSLNKLLNKPGYDVTVIDDLALGGDGNESTGRCAAWVVDRMPWCETQPQCDLEAEDNTVRDRGDLRRRPFGRLV